MPCGNELQKVALALSFLAPMLASCDAASDLEAKVPGVAQLAPSTTPTYLTYSSDVDKYSLKYPSTWTASESIGGPIFTKATLSTTPNACLLSVGTSSLSVPILAFLLSLKGATASTWLDAYADLGDSSLAQGATDVATASAVLGGQAARQIIFTDSVNGRTTKWLIVSTLKNDVAYSLAFLGDPPSALDANLSEAQAIINSFTFSATSP